MFTFFLQVYFYLVNKEERIRHSDDSTDLATTISYINLSNNNLFVDNHVYGGNGTSLTDDCCCCDFCQNDCYDCCFS